MKNKQTERKLRPTLGLTRHLISGVLCLAVISLFCARASAQNLFATSYLSIDEFTPNGVPSIFASGLNNPLALAFDSQGNLFVADQGYGYDVLYDAAVYKFTPSGLQSTVASENDQDPVIPSGLAIDGADNLFVSEYWVSGNILKFTPSGVRTIFAAGSYVTAMAFQPNAAQLLNISTRARVLTQDEVLIGGFIITGAQDKTVLILGIGPSLTTFWIATPLE